MAMKIFPFVVTFLLLIILSLAFPRASSRSSHHHHHHHRHRHRHRHRDHADHISRWCSQTPHQGPCNYYMTRGPHRFAAPRCRSDFRKMLIQLAMERAVEARRHASQLGYSCVNKPQKAAWNDCLKLYDNTVLQLNRTLSGLGGTHNRSCTDIDAQTWLSSALTNLDTCQSGSSELNVSDFISPIAYGFNVSELISNSLAINAAMLDNQQANDDHDQDRDHQDRDFFPIWVTKKERRMLESSASSAGLKANLVVAKDGTGHFRSVQAAINAAGRRRVQSRIVIHVKRGVYRENIEVGVGNDNIMLVGDGLRYTIITSGRSVYAGYTIYSSATAGIDGLRFIAKGITFQNTAGPQKGQAVALRSASDLSVFYRCAFEGYQDTLMVHSQRQFYKQCYIYGTVDFIFGNAAVVFQNCLIYVRRPLKGQVNVITAHGRNDPFQSTAISIHNSQVRAAPDLRPVLGSFKTYLGRPWKLYSRTVFLKCYLDRLVSPAGWLEWNGTPFALKTLYYGEYKNFGPASSTRHRVRWPGFHVINNARVASRFTVGSLISGKSWLPNTGVPFRAGL